MKENKLTTPSVLKKEKYYELQRNHKPITK